MNTPSALSKTVDEYIKPYRRKKGLAIVLSGPSGVGKDTLLEYYLKKYSTCSRLITCTTRPKRDDETDGVDYYFISGDEFEQMKAAGKFLETAEIYGTGRRYGSPIEPLTRMLDEGRNVILRIDVQGGRSVREVMPDAVMIFLAPPSFEELRRRLVKRASETQKDLEIRLNSATAEMEEIPIYDYVIIHDSTEDAAEELECIIRTEMARVIKSE